MARVNIPITQLLQTGVVPPAQTVADPTNDHEVITDPRLFLEVENVGAVLPQTVTLVSPGTVSGLAIEDLVISIPVSSKKLIGPMDSGTFTNSAGKIDINVESADLRFRAYKL